MGDRSVPKIILPNSETLRRGVSTTTALDDPTIVQARLPMVSKQPLVKFRILIGRGPTVVPGIGVDR